MYKIRSQVASDFLLEQVEAWREEDGRVKDASTGSARRLSQRAVIDRHSEAPSLCSLDISQIRLVKSTCGFRVSIVAFGEGARMAVGLAQSKEPASEIEAGSS